MKILGLSCFYPAVPVCDSGDDTSVETYSYSVTHSPGSREAHATFGTPNRANAANLRPAIFMIEGCGASSSKGSSPTSWPGGSSPLPSLQSTSATHELHGRGLLSEYNDTTPIDGLQVAAATRHTTGRPVAAFAEDTGDGGAAPGSSEDGVLQKVVHSSRAANCEAQVQSEAQSSALRIAQDASRGADNTALEWPCAVADECSSGEVDECAAHVASNDDELRRLQILCRHFSESKASEIIRCIREVKHSSCTTPRPLGMPRVLYPRQRKCQEGSQEKRRCCEAAHDAPNHGVLFLRLGLRRKKEPGHSALHSKVRSNGSESGSATAVHHLPARPHLFPFFSNSLAQSFRSLDLNAADADECECERGASRGSGEAASDLAPGVSSSGLVPDSEVPSAASCHDWLEVCMVSSRPIICPVRNQNQRCRP